MAQAKRIADKTAFFLMGELVEHGDTEQIFERKNVCVCVISSYSHIS